MKIEIPQDAFKNKSSEELENIFNLLEEGEPNNEFKLELDLK